METHLQRAGPLLALLVLGACGGKTRAPDYKEPFDSGTDGAEDASNDAISDTSPIDAGHPAPPKSCESGEPGAGVNCGLQSDDDCCASLLVPGGNFLRAYDNVNFKDPSFPATLSPFWLDKYEITAGRFRAFVEAYPSSKPNPGDGANPYVPGSGWKSDWPLAADQAELQQALLNAKKPDCGYPSWRDQPSDTEKRPINCVTWYELFAFCAWDGGFLPTEAEMMFAGAGGAEQRVYPWSVPPTSENVDPSDGLLEWSSPIPGPEDVGLLPIGSGKWGHLDLGGNVAEFVFDWSNAPLPMPCVDCAQFSSGIAGDVRIIRGGAYFSGPTEAQNAQRDNAYASVRGDVFGARCARTGK